MKLLLPVQIKSSSHTFQNILSITNYLSLLCWTTTSIHPFIFLHLSEGQVVGVAA